MRISGSGQVRSAPRYMGAGRASRGVVDAPPQQKKRVYKLSHEAWKLIAPRWGVLSLGFGLMLINRLAGLVLPGSLKYLLDDVVHKEQYGLLGPLVLAIAGATIVQGITSYSLTQLLSKSSQRLINEDRKSTRLNSSHMSISYAVFCLKKKKKKTKKKTH